MTKEEEREVIRVCGEDYDELDVPTYIRERAGKQKCAWCGKTKKFWDEGHYLDDNPEKWFCGWDCKTNAEETKKGGTYNSSKRKWG